jgi:hypothetical protein
MKVIKQDGKLESDLQNKTAFLELLMMLAPLTNQILARALKSLKIQKDNIHLHVQNFVLRELEKEV